MVYRLKGEEILTCLILVVIGYFIAKMFSRCTNGVVNGFSLGGQNSPNELEIKCTMASGALCPDCDIVMEEIQDTCAVWYDACINSPDDPNCSTRLCNMIYDDVAPSIGDSNIMRIVVCLEGGDASTYSVGGRAIDTSKPYNPRTSGH
tara:strand:- start:162 stop:605 length:444 start_codon:yes stop_codon:yes gene_type:complete